jgi:adenine-specific DNA-methyltransferase
LSILVSMEVAKQFPVNSISDLHVAAGPTQQADLYRTDACRHLDSEQRSRKGQFFTPPSVARFMASLFGESSPEIRLLDAGAGVGTSTAAFVEETCQRNVRPDTLTVIAYESEPLLAEYLHSVLVECQEFCQEGGAPPRRSGDL